MRRCASAGEALPADIGKRWTDHFGVEILDGLGSTEMLHIFLSNRPGDVRYGTTGMPGAGLRARIIGDDGAPVPQGEVGELQISRPDKRDGVLEQPRRKAATPSRDRGPAAATSTRSTAKGTTSTRAEPTTCSRSSGIYVSPVEVESALITHAAVLEAAVVGKADEDNS